MGARTPLFGIGIAAKSPYVTAKMLTNMYCEQRPQGEKSSLVAYGAPGLDLFTDFGAVGCRGGLEFHINSVAYVVHLDTLYEVNNAGIATAVGAMTHTTGRVSMAHNGVQIMIVDGTRGWIYNTSTLAFAQIVDGDFPANPVTCCYLGQRFVVSFNNSNRFYWSDLNNGLSWDPLNFATAETNPDPIEEVYASNGQLVILGPETTEFWGVGQTADAAFVPLTGTGNEWGTTAPWSIAKFDNTFALVMRNRMGQSMIAQMNGYLPKKISTVDIDSIINGYATTADASAYSYMLGGHPMYVVSFPTAGASWLFDGSTQQWSSLRSAGSTRHISEFSFNLLERTIVADYGTGKLYAINPNTLTDNGSMIEREIIGETVASKGEEFLDINVLRVDIEAGVGLTLGQGVNPQIALSVSRDNGKTYGPDMWKTMGAIGQYATRVEWRRLGSSRYFTPKIKITDPVLCVVVSACINPDN